MSTVNNQPPVAPTTTTGIGSGGSIPTGGTDQGVANLLNAVLQQTNLGSILQNSGNTPATRSLVIQDAITNDANVTQLGAPANRSIDTSNPNLKPPSNDTQPPEITSGNPWLKPSALAAFLTVMFEVASIMSKMKLIDVKNEIREIQFRQSSVEAHAKNIIDQAEIEMVKAICQAVVSFVSAGLAIGMAIGSAGTGKRAEDAVAKDAKALKHNEKCEGNKGVEQWIDKKAQLSTEQNNLNKMVVGQKGPNGEMVTKKSYAEQQKKVAELKEFVDTHKPGFQQFQEYQNEKFGVKTNEDGTYQSYSKTSEDKNKQIDKQNNKEEIILTEEKGLTKSSGDTQKTDKDIKNQDTSQDKNIKVTKDEKKEEAQISNEERYSKEASAEGMKMQKQHDDLLDPNSQTRQTAISNKMQQYNMMYQALTSANQSIAQALNGLIGAGFELQVAGLKSDDVYIQATMDGAQKVIDSFEENRKNTMQNLNDLFSNMLNYIQTYWSGVGSFKQS